VKTSTRNASPSGNRSRRTYQELGNPPLELEATLSLAFCYWQSDRARAEQLLEEVWQRLRTEQDISLELAQALSFCAEDWFEAKEWAICQRLWERALTMRQALMNADDTSYSRRRATTSAWSPSDRTNWTRLKPICAPRSTTHEQLLIPHTSVPWQRRSKRSAN
jgi:hypothetical protein